MVFTYEIYCPICSCAHHVEACEDDVIAWQEGALIQNVMPYLSPTEREQFISGLCPACQEKIFDFS